MMRVGRIIVFLLLLLNAVFVSLSLSSTKSYAKLHKTDIVFQQAEPDYFEDDPDDQKFYLFCSMLLCMRHGDKVVDMLPMMILAHYRHSLFKPPKSTTI